jgi:ferredoxin-NADP reductase
MLPTPVSAGLGLLFILTGVAAVWLIFAASTLSGNQTARDRILRAHRVAGYVFIALFCFMTWFMLLRVKDAPDELPLRSMLHVLIAMVLAPLLLVKVLIARYYKSFTAALVPLGLTIFTLGFVLIASSAGPYLLRKAAVKEISLQTVNMEGVKIGLRPAEALAQKRCSRCHNLDRVVSARKDARGWLATVNNMRALPGSGISETDGKIILSYLTSQYSIDSSSSQGELTIGKALVDSHCNRCHALDRTYQSVKSPAAWKETVIRMVKYARGTEGFFKPGEDDRIVKFLSTTQTPEAAQTRLSSTFDSAPDGRQTENRVEPAEHARFVSSLPSVGVTAIIAVVFVPLMWRRPKSHFQKAAAVSAVSPAVEQGPARNTRRSVMLQLVRTERQTHDCVSLRFRITEAGALRAKPGQFLTFDWLLDGRKVARCYSISSSPTQTGFVEITVKNQSQGCVSTFLNERVSMGLTVEAKGPSGRFCFDENEHKSIVLLAAGSGITPVISILRYIDDLCLDTEVTLFYSVRTQRDIIFEPELERLEERLRNFQQVIILTRPESGWKGWTGRITGELVVKGLGEIGKQTFFLCGPQGFMDHVNGILLSLGIGEKRIIRESFGGKRASEQADTESEAPGGAIEFTRSGSTCVFPAGRTLLEAAEMSGIHIPSSCRQGQCGTCATRLLGGDIKMDREDGLDPALKAQGYVLACVARAEGNVRLDA